MNGKLTRIVFLLLATALLCTSASFGADEKPAAKPAEKAAEEKEAAPPPPPPPPPRSIEIVAEIFEYRISDEFQFGLLYEYVRATGDLLDGDLFLPGTPGPGDIPIPALQMTFDFLNTHYGDLNTTLQAARQKGQATVLSNSRIVVMDGNPAKIINGEQVPITTLQIKGNKQTLSSVLKPTGVKLFVTPTILMDNFILLSIQAGVSEIVALEKFSPVGTTGQDALFELPRVQSRTVQTVVLVPDGQSFIIGGLINETQKKANRKIPVLSDIPYLGFPFRSKSEEVFFTETLFHITPRILEPGEGGSLPLKSVGEGLDPSFLGAQSIDDATGALLIEEQLDDESEAILQYNQD